MPARRCTILYGTIIAVSPRAVKLRLAACISNDTLPWRTLWIPRQSIEGGSIMTVEDRDPAVSTFWLNRKLNRRPAL